MTIAISYTYPGEKIGSTVVQGIQGRSNAYWAMRSIKQSGIVKHHYVFSHLDEVLNEAESLGCKTLPFKMATGLRKDKLKAAVQNIIAESILADLGEEHDGPLPPLRKLLNNHGIFVQYSYNQCMIRPKSYSMMHEMALQGRPVVRPAIQLRNHEVVGLLDDDGSSHPFMWDGSRESYNKTTLPKIGVFFTETSFMNYSAGQPGRKRHFVKVVDKIEGTWVDNKTTARIMGVYLDSDQDYWNRS